MAPALVAAGCVAASFLAAAPSQASRTAATPRWILHIQRYPGGISNGVRAMVSPEAVAARRAPGLDHRGFGVVRAQRADEQRFQTRRCRRTRRRSRGQPRQPEVAVAAASDVSGGNGVIMPYRRRAALGIDPR
jgi:hypothetical protein